MSESWRDRLLLVVAAASEQRGVVTSAQLAECGFSRHGIPRLVAAGWLRPIRRGAYAVATQRPSIWDGIVAVGLLGGAGTALSHCTAARIHDLPHLVKSARVELSALPPKQPVMSGVVVHRVGRLDREDIVEKRGFLVTSPARTIIDLSPRMSRPLLERVIDEGCVQRLWTPADIAASSRRTGSIRRPGSRGLDALLDPRLDDSAVATSLEARVVRLLAPLRPFVTQHQVVVDGHVVVLDVAWPEWFAGVEADGRWPRATSYSKFHSDRVKGNLLLAHGWKIVHVTAAMSDDAILRDVLRILPEQVARQASSRPPRGR